MSKRILFPTLFLFVMAFILVAGRAFAQDDVTPEPPIDIIVPPDWNMDGLAVDFQRVNVTIENQVATTHIEQLFVNENDWVLEGTYLFPLPNGAAVSQLTMWVDGQPIEAKILEKDEAREIYDAIVRQLRDPALLEYVENDAIQANVFPIPPHDERRIEIEYSQILPAENGLVHYVFPQATNLYTNTPLDSQSIRVEVESNEPIHAIYSPSHRVAISRDGEFKAVAGYEEENVTPQQDFEFYYTISPDEIGLNLLSYRETNEDGFFVLLVAPKVEAEQVIAKDVILVLDNSGSMEGDKMQQAKEAATYVVEHLNAEDRFNIIAFSTGVRFYAPELLDSSDAGNYESFINGLEAVGGTNISSALLEAAVQTDPQRPTTIIFVTDGLATEGITETPLLLDAVGEATPDNARIFSFGVGDDVDPNLLDTLAQNHRGTTTYVRPNQAIDEEVSSFYAKVSSPVLSNIALDVDGVIVEQLYPQILPDLFAGSQLIVTGRYREGGPVTVTLTGEVNGNPQTFTYEDNVLRVSGGDEFIPRLWATRAIGHLLREIRLHGENDELVSSIVNLSIRYGIITPYTSYLIEEDDIFSQSGRDDIVEGELSMEEADGSFAPSVEEAADQAMMAEAESALPLATAPAGGLTSQSSDERQTDETLVQYIGSKTFVWRDGTWMDTAYDVDEHQIDEIGFAGDLYFELLSAVPELGQYLAVGQQVLVVHDGRAYRIVEGEGQSTIELPEVVETIPPDTGVTIEPDNTAVEEADATVQFEKETSAAPASTPESDSTSAVPSSGCASLLALPALLAFGMIVSRFGRR